MPADLSPRLSVPQLLHLQEDVRRQMAMRRVPPAIVRLSQDIRERLKELGTAHAR